MGKRGRPRKVKEQERTETHVKRIDVKLPESVYTQVRKAVKDGLFISLSAFGRTAIREKLAKLGSAKKG